MHIPDGFLNGLVSVGTGVVAAGGLAVCLRRARQELDERTAPLAGLVSAFVFAAQMINFPVGAGTSGHLLGGALAAILAGPYMGALCISVVLLVQGFFFADGGLSALGANILIMAIIPSFLGYGVFRAVTGNRGRARVGAGAFAAAALSVPCAALVFAVLFWIGGTKVLPLGTVATAMGGVHVLIGLGEGLITMVAVTAVLAARPDLVYGARHLARPLVLRTASAGEDPAPVLATTTATATAARAAVSAPETAGGTAAETGSEAAPADRPAARRLGPFAVAAVIISMAVAGGLSFFASSSPDGLERVAGDLGFSEQATDHALAGSPLGDYGESAGLPVGVAGVIGVVVTLGVGGGLTFVLRRRPSGRGEG